MVRKHRRLLSHLKDKFGIVLVVAKVAMSTRSSWTMRNWNLQKHFERLPSKQASYWNHKKRPAVLPQEKNYCMRSIRLPENFIIMCLPNFLQAKKLGNISKIAE